MSSRVAIAREVTVRIVKMLSEKNVKITQRGTKAFVEYNKRGVPSRVNIPYTPDDASDSLLDAVQGFIDHEVAHILYTDYKALQRADKEGVKKVHNIIEDSFIERKMARNFAGSGLNLRNVGSFFLREHTDKQLKENPEAADAILFIAAVRAWGGHQLYKEYMGDKWHHMKKITDALGDTVNDVIKCETSNDCVDLALKFKSLLSKPEEKKSGDEGKEKGEGAGESKKSSSKGKGKKEKGEPTPEKAKDEEEKPSEEEEAKEEPASEEAEGSEKEDEPADDEEGEIGDFLEDEEEDERDQEEDDDADEDDKGEDSSSDSSEASNEPSEPESTKSSTSEVGDDDEESEEGEVSMMATPPSLMDEIEDKVPDFNEVISAALSEMATEEMSKSEYTVHTKEFDVIEPLKVSDFFDEKEVERMQNKVDHLVAPLQKDLERAIAAKSASTWSAGHRSGRLNPSSLSRLATFKDGRVFRRREISTSKDVAVSLLVDCSGSMCGDKIEIAAHAAYGLTAVLDRMGIVCESLGFTTGKGIPTGDDKFDYSRVEILYMPVFKAFNERLLPEHKRRFAYLPHCDIYRNNIDGESIDVAASRLAKRPETRKILMVLSDGQPAGHGDMSALRTHLLKTVKSVEQSGIDVLGIGIQDDSVKHYYSKSVVINNVAELPTVVIGQIKQLLIK